MAKKRTNSTQRKPEAAKPGAKKTNSAGRSIGKVIGCVALLAFVMVEDLWMGIGIFALVFAALYVMQVFFEKSASWFSSGYLYATLGCSALAWAEHQYQIITRLISFGK